MSRIKMAQPRMAMAPERIKMAKPLRLSKTLKERQAETGRTLALNGAAWRKLRAYVLAESPLCEHCAERGLVVPATDVDHIDNDPSNNSMANLSSQCHECHSRKTQADMGKSVAWGCDQHGMPLDPCHPWNKRTTARLPALLRPVDEKSPGADGCEPPCTSSIHGNCKEP
ncbi:MAG: HNH endonuclease [Comamonadaceae bacterium]|nr:HNH endonuclease [Comamonadaceae bacterium]